MKSGLVDLIKKSKTNKGLLPLHIAVNAEETGSADAFLDPIEWLLRHGAPPSATVSLPLTHLLFEDYQEWLVRIVLIFVFIREWGTYGMIILAV